MTQYAIPGYHPIKSPKQDASIRAPFYKVFVIATEDNISTWRILAYVGFNSPKLLAEGDTSSPEFHAGPPKELRFNFAEAEWAENWRNGTFLVEISNSSGEIIQTKHLEVSD